MSGVQCLRLRRELLMDTQSIREAIARTHQPRHAPHRPSTLLCSCGKLEPLDQRPVYVEFTAVHVIDAFLAALQTSAIELVQRAEPVPPRPHARGDYNTPRCPASCDCSCCYGSTDKSCHCFADPCNCGGDRAAHGQKPLTTDPEETTDR